MSVKSEKVFQLFQQYRKQKFIFITPVGNWGDSLIFKGAEKLAIKAGLQYEFISCAQYRQLSYPADHVLYIFGNGGFNEIWNGEHVYAFARAVSTHTGTVILGPTTFLNNEHFLVERMKPALKDIKAEKVHMFSRGNLFNNDFFENLPSPVVFDLDHDTALNLEHQDLLSALGTAGGTLYAIRIDKEANKEPVKFRPFLVWFDPIDMARTFQEWLNIHNGVEKIVTNRLHSAILGTILKKKVTLLPNNYHKNRGLWEYSLKDLGVEWREKLELSKLEQRLIENELYKRLSNSYKISQFVNSSYLKRAMDERT